MPSRPDYYSPYSSAVARISSFPFNFRFNSLEQLEQKLRTEQENNISEPGEEEGDGGRQKSQSGDLSRLSGEPEDSDPGDCSLDPGDSRSAVRTCLWASELVPNSPSDLVSDDNKVKLL